MNQIALDMDVAIGSWAAPGLCKISLVNSYSRVEIKLCKILIIIPTVSNSNVYEANVSIIVIKCWLCNVYSDQIGYTLYYIPYINDSSTRSYNFLKGGSLNIYVSLKSSYVY